MTDRSEIDVQASTEPTEEELAEALKQAKIRFEATVPEDWKRPAEVFTGQTIRARTLTEEEIEEIRIREEEARAANQADIVEWETEQEAKLLEQLRRKSKLPLLFRERFTFAAYAPKNRSQKAALERVQAFVDSPQRYAPGGEGLFLFGPPATGKTHLAVSTMQHLIDEKRVPCLFVTVPGMLEEERGRFEMSESGSISAIEEAKGAPVLILDDLGTEKTSEWVREKLFELINHRYMHGLPTLITTNAGPEELEDRLGGRIVSRIAGMCEWIEVTGGDHRMKVKA